MINEKKILFRSYIKYHYYLFAFNKISGNSLSFIFAINYYILFWIIFLSAEKYIVM